MGLGRYRVCSDSTGGCRGGTVMLLIGFSSTSTAKMLWGLERVKAVDCERADQLFVKCRWEWNLYFYIGPVHVVSIHEGPENDGMSVQKPFSWLKACWVAAGAAAARFSSADALGIRSNRSEMHHS